MGTPVFYKAKDILTCAKVEPIDEDIPFRDLKIKSLSKVKRTTGFYSIFYKGNLIYIGIFASDKSGPVDKLRWLKHIETMTMRGQKATLAKGSQVFIREAGFGDLFFYDAESFTNAQGRVSSKGRALFAAENWKIFKKATPSNILNDFEFMLYPSFLSKKRMQKLEKELIDELQPRCNLKEPPKKVYDRSIVVKAFDKILKKRGLFTKVNE